MAGASTKAWSADWACWGWRSALAVSAAPFRSILNWAGEQPFPPSFRFRRCRKGKQRPMPPIRILLADDHAVVRDGLRALLDRQPDLTVVAEACDGRECIRLAEEHSPDVVMMDVAMPNLNGIEAARRIVAAHPGTAVVVLSMHLDESYVLQSLRAGAKAYLLKDSSREDVLEAIRSAANGRSFLSRKVSRMLQQDYI